MDKIQLVSQPNHNEGDNENKILQLTLCKLQELVKENPAQDTEEADNVDVECPDRSQDAKRHNKHSKETVSIAQGSDVHYDQDGFEIPTGKIPLDGHFSTAEIQELVKLAQEKGIISDGIKVTVVSENDTVGDTIQISDSQDL